MTRGSVSPDTNLLDVTLAAAKRDVQSVTPAGESVSPLLDGMQARFLPPHTDERGTVFEMFDIRWDWYLDPVTFMYYFSIRPGFAKGWGLHKEHEDRYILIQGEMELVLYDVRSQSKTYGKIVKLYLSEQNRRIVNIPRFVWHADRNIGSKDAVVINLPTKPFDHTNPDKYRLPLDTDLIPHSFGNVSGW
ncbi:MAG: hypothetical protein QOF19_1131 [Alphaproteobacteria bacterium]|nr:hypothetical protein [Alphaproteobacteria bacterium]